MKNNQILRIFLKNNQNQMEIVRKRISECPQGTIYEQIKRGKPYYIQADYKDKKQFRTGISLKPKIVQGLIRKYLWESELKVLEQNQNKLNGINGVFDEFDLEKSIKALQKRCPSISDDMISDALSEYAKSSWAREEYEQSMYKPEERRQINSHGLRLRSKSEVLISEKLYEYGLEFHYEQVIHIGDTSLVPDFIIRRSDGKKFVWEHEGLTNVQSYLKWQDQKAKLYAGIGIVPWDNLIVTYDNSDGIIDLRIVESEIKNKLII